MVEQLVPYLQVWLNDQAAEARVRNSLIKFFKEQAILDPQVVRRTILFCELTQAHRLAPEAISKRNDDGTPTGGRNSGNRWNHPSHRQCFATMGRDLRRLQWRRGRKWKGRMRHVLRAKIWVKTQETHQIDHLLEISPNDDSYWRQRSATRLR